MKRLVGAPRRKLIACLALLMYVLSAPIAAPAFADGAEVSFSPATINVDAGGKFETDVVVTTESFTRGIQFGLFYDPKLIRIDSITDGPFYVDWAAAHHATASSVIAFTPDNTRGHVSIGALAIFGGPDDGPVGSGAAVHIQGSAVEGATGTATIEFDNLLVSGFAVAIQPLRASGLSIGLGQAPATQPRAALVPTTEARRGEHAQVDVSQLSDGPYDGVIVALSPWRPFFPLVVFILGACLMIVVYRGIMALPVNDPADAAHKRK